MLFTIFICSLILSSLSLLVLMLNTVHSLLLLLEIFVIGTVLLFIFRVEFLGLIFLMIYLGAILVLFLFVVMMLDIKTTAVQNDDLSGFLLKGIGIWFFLPIFIWWLFTDVISFSGILNVIEKEIPFNFHWSNQYFILDFFQIIITTTNLQTIGWYLFDFQGFLFILSGFILYIAMVGAIVISVAHNNTQNQKLQNALVQGMRKGNIIAYHFNKPGDLRYFDKIPHWHLGKDWYPKPKQSFWKWLGKNTPVQR